MSYPLPGLSFRLFGFPVTIQLDFFVIALLLGFNGRGGIFLVEWIAVVTLAILVHELGHAFAVRAYGIHPEIRLWGLGGLTVFGFALPPRKAIAVSAAGPLVGVPIGLFAMVARPWLPPNDLLQSVLWDVQWVSLGWGIVNLLPIAGLDGGSIVENGFLLAFGSRGRTPALVTIAIAGIVIAIGAALAGFVYLTLVIFLFGLMNPAPYLELRRAFGGLRGTAGGGPARSGSAAGRGAPYTYAGRTSGTAVAAPPKPVAASVEERRTSRRATPAVLVAAQVRRPFGELYAETLGPSDLDLDDFEDRPEPLLADVTRMLARADDAAVAARLAAEDDPLAVLGIVARVADEKRTRAVLAAARSLDDAQRAASLVRMQLALHALGRFDEAIAASESLGTLGDAATAVVEARSAARQGDRKRTRAALERSVSMGSPELSDAALGDIVRIGPDAGVAELLARLRKGAVS